jgi:hypothetical protein
LPNGNQELPQWQANLRAEATKLRAVARSSYVAFARGWSDLVQILGSEEACLRLAECRQWLIASDEKKKFRRETLARLGTGRLLNTPCILILAISNGILTVEDADHAKAVLEQHRFIMGFRSFGDVLP